MWQRLKDVDKSAVSSIEVRRGQRVATAQVADGIWLGYMGGAVYVPRVQASAQRPSPNNQRPGQAMTGTQSLRAPMAGRIVEQHGAVGEARRKGETLVVLEAMKMEYRVIAPADGRITALHGAPGDAVALDAVLVTFVCDANG